MSETIGTWKFSYTSETEEKYDNEAENMTTKTKDMVVDENRKIYVCNITLKCFGVKLFGLLINHLY